MVINNIIYIILLLSVYCYNLFCIGVLKLFILKVIL